MAPSDKNFIRNLCLAAGLFFAFLLIAPINFTAPAGTGPAPVGVDTKTVPLPEVPVVPEVVPEVNEVVSEVPDVVPEVPEVPDATAAPSAEFLDVSSFMYCITLCYRDHFNYSDIVLTISVENALAGHDRFL